MTIVYGEPPPRLRGSFRSEALVRLRALSTLLGGFNYRYGSEVQLHATLAQVLLEAGHEFVREFQLDQNNRADFASASSSCSLARCRSRSSRWCSFRRAASSEGVRCSSCPVFEWTTWSLPSFSPRTW